MAVPDVYAVNLVARSRRSDSATEAFQQALRDWIGERWPDGLDWFRADTPRAVDAGAGTIFRWEPYTAGDRTLIDFVWRHPHDQNPEIDWWTRVAYFREGTTQLVVIKVANSGPELDYVGNLLTTRPRLVLHLLEHFELSDGDECFSDKALTVDESTVQDFVQYYLCAPERRSPLVIVSPGQDGCYKLAPGAAAPQFATLASCYVLATPAASFALTRALQHKELSCFNGAIRAYMPGFSRSSNPYDHPLILPERVVAGSRRLANVLARATLRRFRDDPRVGDLRDERAVALNEGQEKLLSTLEGLRATAGSAETWRSLAEDLDQQGLRLRSELDATREQLRYSEDKARALEYALQQSRLADGEELAEEPQVLCETPEEAVELAANMYEDELVVLASSFESARNSPFRRPKDIFAALKSIAELKRQQRKGLGRSLREVFAALGQDYRLGVSESTNKKLRGQFKFARDGQQVSCEEHLCIGKGTYDPGTCARIYFRFGPPEDHAVVGHVGRHLDVMTTS